MRGALLMVVCASALTGCAGLQQTGRFAAATESDIISPSLAAMLFTLRSG